MPESLPEAQFMPLLLTVLAAISVGAGFYWAGNRTTRAWAVPLAAAILFYGLSTYYALPDWAVIGGVLVTPLVFHQIVRRRLESVARGADKVELEGMTLRRVSDPAGRHVAVWTSAPEGRPRVTLDPHQEPVVLALDFEGEAEDEFRVVLRAQVGAHCPGALVAQHEDADRDLTGVLSNQEPIEGLPGLTADLRVRALPPEFAFRVLDLPTIIALHEILRLRTEKREVYVHVNGPQMRVVATDVYAREDLPRLLKPAVILFQRIRAIGLEEKG